jgi:hypothetical protein
MTDYDNPFKEALDRFFAPVLAFLLPKAHSEIDWTKDPESLETELRKALPEAETGLKRVDKLVKVIRKESGDPAYLHIEAQMFAEVGFDKRMYDYNRKAEEVYNSPVVSLAILGDDDPDWRPDRYHFTLWGCTKTFRFVARKLLDWRGKEEKLERHKNPFALFVLAHLQTLATRKDEDKRAEWKERLMANIVGRKLDAEDRREWLRLIDWLMELPQERNRLLWDNLRRRQREKENVMPFISYLEQREIDARKEGRDEGRNEGAKDTLLEAIQTVLAVQLPQQEKSLLAKAVKIDDLDLLRQVFRAAAVGNLGELNRLLP